MFRIAALLYFRGAGLELDMSVYGCISTAPAEGMLEARSRAASRVKLIRTPTNVKTRAQLNTLRRACENRALRKARIENP